jgi:hypothetical protein
VLAVNEHRSHCSVKNCDERVSLFIYALETKRGTRMHATSQLILERLKAFSNYFD